METYNQQRALRPSALGRENYCVILAGGRGRRLWPCSRSSHPKQFVDFFGTGRTQLQTTFDRFSGLLPLENIYVCTCREYRQLVSSQLPEVPERNILVEPVHRNTAPSVAWATMRILQQNPKANIVVTPSDQMVVDEDRFRQSLETGIGYVAQNDVLLCMGVSPTRPEPGYGYIQMGDAGSKPGVYRVKSFTEKPEREFAKMFMESGEFCWNTGIFISNARKLISSFEDVLPSVLRELRYQHPDRTYDEEMQYVADHYSLYPNLSLDYAILEHSRDVFVMKCDFGWADLGTWHAIYECMSKGQDDNVIIDSQVMTEDSHGNVIKLPHGRLGVISGLDGYIVAEEGNVLLICKKGDSSALVRKYVNEVNMNYGDDFV